MEKIISKDNSLVKEIKKLKEKKYRSEKNRFIIEGFRFVSEALDSLFKVPFIFIDEKSLDKYKSFNIDIKLNKETRVILVNEALIKQLSSTDTPQGIIAVVENSKVELNKNKGFYVLADKVQDPGNMGTIIRTADAANALGVIVTKGTVDIYNEKTLRSTMGSIFHVPIIEEDEKFSRVLELKKDGFKIVVSSLQTEENFFDIDATEKLIIAVGNEGNGVSEEIIKASDIKVKIPMPGMSESLNVSVAAAVMMFEVVRQNMLKKT